MSDRSTYAKAVAGYDSAHERALLEAITKAIFDTSLCSDANVCAIRTGELCNALLTALASAMAMSPAVTRSPTQTRKTVDELHRRLRRRIVAAEADPEVQDFLRRMFRGTDVGGHA